MAIRVVMLNTWGGRIFEPLMKYIRQIDADVLCLQEIFSSPETSISALEDSLEVSGRKIRVNLFSDLRQILPEYHGFFWPTAQEHLNDEISARIPAFYGIATFVRQTIPILESRTKFVFQEFRPLVYDDTPLPRNAHCIRLWMYDNNTSIIIAHMHGLWHPDGKTDCPERELQAEALTMLLEEMVKPNDKIVVCGDFNLLPQSSTFKTLSRLGLSDLVVSTGHTDTRTSFYPKAVRYADYLLVSPEVKVKRFDVPTEPEVSDHRPLILDCE